MIREPLSAMHYVVLLYVTLTSSNSTQACVWRTEILERNSSSTYQEYPWNLKVHYRIHMKPLLVHMLCQTNLVLTGPSLYEPF